MILCKHCGGEECVKNGLIKGKQRYLCRACVKTFRLGDAREKYSLEKRIKVIKLYTEGMGLRSIERIDFTLISRSYLWSQDSFQLISYTPTIYRIFMYTKDLTR